ncbi:uncharacterized protein BXZ73DRAFT_97777 [Epithele typhae]|uniref:uncharacterized protein n=1 Tax=Epithele typhae TaxID=378194 RepID=UPI00200873BD|nr:uncharacterized protein BXZ73DRAFT_97777 [Epithele typhae]KAH9942362.1 hypothetical protein BXZ73DRAFT_97777 [Epithele typhae]
MQFKVFLTLAATAAVASALVPADRRDDAVTGTPSFTTFFTTQTFTASQVFPVFQEVAPFVTTQTTITTWTVSRTVTMAATGTSA